MGTRSLAFVAPHVEGYLEAMRALQTGHPQRVQLRTDGELGHALEAALYADPDQWQVEHLPAGAGAAGLVVLSETDPEALSEQLLHYADQDFVHIIAPRTARHFRAQALFLVTVPKSGTHLTRGLLRAFGYAEGNEHNYTPEPGTWYCLEYSNTHTRAADFFVDSVRRAPFGNRHHPFPHTPTLFLYRNPLDILVSEANYYHRDGNTIYAGYLGSLNREQRLDRLISDPWLLGSLRDRMAAYVPWLGFPNVVPVSFEELIGEAGGGDNELQQQTVWALQLKLHVPGRPEDYARQIFDPDSPTFARGRIGQQHELLGPAQRTALLDLNQDFMEAFGFRLQQAGADDWRPGRAAEFRHRPLRLAPNLSAQIPVLAESSVFDFNLVFFAGCYWAVPRALGPVDIAALPEAQRNCLPHAATAADLRQILELGPEHARLVARWLHTEVVPAISRSAPLPSHPLDFVARMAGVAQRVRVLLRKLRYSTK